jgi:ABC-type multidrug transport system fused ATPase/permease subunit
MKGILSRARKRWRATWNKWSRFVEVGSRLGSYLRHRRRSMTVALALSLAFTATRLLEPWPMKLVIDWVLLGQPLPDSLASIPGVSQGSRMTLLYALAGAIIALAMLRGLVYLRHRLIVARLGIEVSAELRLDLYQHIQGLSLNFHDRRRTGDLIVRLTSDIRMLRAAFLSLPLELVESVLLMAGMTAVMLAMDWKLALLALALLPLVALLVRRYQRPMRQAIRKQREREGHLASLASEALGAIRVVQGFRRERQEVRRFGGANRRDMRSGMKASRYEAKLRWAADLAVSAVTAFILLLAARRILAGALSVGDLVVFVSYLRVFARPLRRVSRTTERMIRATAAGERVLRILETPASVTDAPDAVSAPRFRGEVELRGVCFSYGGKGSVLQNVDLSIRAGERVAIVGPTGAGKSTLVSLLPRLYDPAAGEVRVDGLDIRKLTLDSLRRQIAIVFQEPVLFATTVAENIGYGKPGADREAVVRAARRARVDRVIERLPDGYDTVLGERGGTLSGGQRQCVAIARAMVRNASILILDEPTTGLDARSAARVNRALSRLMRGRTVLMITHDPRNLEGVDRVVRLKHGVVVADGPPDAGTEPSAREAS